MAAGERPQRRSCACPLTAFEHAGEEAISEFETQQLLQRNKGRAFVATQQQKRAPPPRPALAPLKKQRLVKTSRIKAGSDDDDDDGEAEVSASDEDDEEEGEGDDDEEATHEAKRAAKREAKRPAKGDTSQRAPTRPLKAAKAAKPAPPKSARAAWEHKQKLATSKASTPPSQPPAAAAASALPLRKRLPDPKKGWPLPYQRPTQHGPVPSGGVSGSGAATSRPVDEFREPGPPAIEAVAPRKQSAGMWQGPS